MEDVVERFYIASIIGRPAGADGCFSQDELISGCIRKAYDDMLQGGRYYGIRGKGGKCDAFAKLLESCKYEPSAELIDETAKLFGGEIESAKRSGATAFGLAQKLVNMCFKYLYCVRDHLDFQIDFTKCDCPLDSVILRSLGERRTTWTRIDKDAYSSVQRAIEDRVSTMDFPACPKGISKKLYYDFVIW